MGSSGFPADPGRGVEGSAEWSTEEVRERGRSVDAEPAREDARLLCIAAANRSIAETTTSGDGDRLCAAAAAASSAAAAATSAVSGANGSDDGAASAGGFGGK